MMAAVRRVAARAAKTPVPGEAELPPEEQVIREATRRRRLDTIALFITRLGRVGLFVLGGLGAVAILLPEVIAGLGALGVALGAAIGAALGFGAQQLIRDYLNGILILGENPFSVGDFVTIAGVEGTVEEVGLRRTVMRDVDGAVHSVPNGEILVATNFTRTFARVRERFVVAPGTDIGRATAVLNDACAVLAVDDAWRERFIEPPHVMRIAAAAPGELGIPILVTATVRPGEQWEVAGELRLRAIDAMRVAGIDLAAGRTVLVTRGAPTDSGPAADSEGSAEYT
jgi:small conductance mechanosensitive channel